MKYISYISGFFRSDRPQSISMVCLVMITVAVVWTMFYKLYHGEEIDYYGLSALEGTAFGFKTLGKKYDKPELLNNINNEKTNPFNSDRDTIG